MTIQGLYTKRAGERTAKEEGAAIRAARLKDMQDRDAARQVMYRLEALKSAAQGADSKLSEVVKLYDRRAADVAGMREEGAETGRIHPALAGAVAELAEYPPMVALARTRAEVARAAYDSEVARQAAKVVEVEPEVAPIPDAPRGRGRPGEGCELMPVNPQAEQLAAHLVRDEAVRADDAVFVADLVCDRLRWPEGGGAPIVLATDGQPAPGLTVADVIATVRLTLPSAFAGGPVPPKPAPNTHTARAIAERDARLSGVKVGDPNPFAPATRNLTRASILERDDPALAAKLKAAARV